jgi:SAM-dependent methyltransferase
MYRDVVDIRDFYETPLGRVTRQLVTRKIQAIWPDLKGFVALGLGYPCPYLEPYLEEASRTLAFMPAQQGVVHWPEAAPSLTALIDEHNLPLPNESVDRILLVHQLEFANPLGPFLRELWRVLSPNGHILVVVPNRRGMWARFDNTPLGHGQPYSKSQLTNLLRESLFTPVQAERCLYIPPIQSRTLLAATPLFEKIGHKLLPKFSGVLLIEAIKQVYGTAPLKQKAPSHAPSLVGA